MGAIFDRCAQIMLAKRQQRGTENIERQGVLGVLRRVAEDKMARLLRSADLEDLRKRCVALGMPEADLDRLLPAEPDMRIFGEVDPFDDDVIDCINYLAIVLMLRNGTWGARG